MTDIDESHMTPIIYSLRMERYLDNPNDDGKLRRRETWLYQFQGEKYKKGYGKTPVNVCDRGSKLYP